MKIIEVTEKTTKDGKEFWNITVEGGPSKYANWFDLPKPQVGQTEFDMIQGKAYTDKQGKERHYYNAKASNGSAKITELEKRVEAIEKFLSKKQTPQPDNMNDDPMGSIPDDDEFPM